MSDQAIADIFKHRNIVVEGVNHSEDGQFDVDTIDSLGDFRKVTAIHGNFFPSRI